MAFGRTCCSSHHEYITCVRAHHQVGGAIDTQVVEKQELHERLAKVTASVTTRSTTGVRSFEEGVMLGVEGRTVQQCSSKASGTTMRER